MILPDLRDYRNAILRCYGTARATPSVEVPLGDFFGVTHGRIREFSSAFMAVNPASVRRTASTPTSRCRSPTMRGSRSRTAATVPIGGPLGGFWYHVEYEVCDERRRRRARFHADTGKSARRLPIGAEPNVHAPPGAEPRRRRELRRARRRRRGPDGRAACSRSRTSQARLVRRGRRHGVHRRRHVAAVDPRHRGPKRSSAAARARRASTRARTRGFHLVESRGLRGPRRRVPLVRRRPDPLRASLRWTIEHGHANNFANDYSSVAYWYQTPQAVLPALPAPEEMRPTLGPRHDEARELLLRTVAENFGGQRFFGACQAGGEYFRGRFDAAVADLERFRSS